MTLYLAGNYINGTRPVGLSYGHLQIVYGDQEIEVQSGFFLFAGNWKFEKREHEINGLDSDNPNHYAKVALNLGGRHSSDVWTVINDAAKDISIYTIPYNMDYNSNTFVATLLSITGIETTLPYPGWVTSYPGLWSYTSSLMHDHTDRGNSIRLSSTIWLCAIVWTKPYWRH